nr:hypothetical protein [uncultured bacterium]AMP54291.1 hypothetical protein [uncultured bacterium]AMP54367.1 hypothetical protein [uncultured bacterium]AMP54406.1 hypothetical protein [uncultured bacterium]AMP54455.1 hypothetical protein [uncultured bacterium]
MRLPAYSGTLTASAEILSPQKAYRASITDTQERLWDYYQRLGEFQAAIMWRANSVSRMRLVAAEIVPGTGEPVPLEDDNPAVEAMSRLAGGTSGQSRLIRDITIHLGVAGEGYLWGYESPAGIDEWKVLAIDAAQVDRKSGPQLKVGETAGGRGRWEDLDSSQSVLVRFWEPDPRKHWEAWPYAKGALSALAELDLINKRIIAEITSRLTSNGLLFYDEDRLSIDQSGDTPETLSKQEVFANELVSTAEQGIKNPMSPHATIPIPIGVQQGDSDVPLEDLVYHLQFAGLISEQSLSIRESALRRVAATLDQPPETVLGVEGLNHWGARQVEESALKTVLSSTIENICHTLCVSYLTPYLQAQGASQLGPHGGRIIVWYDPSELVHRPDKSSLAREAWDRAVISDVAYRREAGFNEDDAPTSENIEERAAREQTLRLPATMSDVPTLDGLDDISGPEPATDTMTGEEE